MTIDDIELVGVPRNSGRGPSIQVRSGMLFYILDPWPEEILIDDIAAALSKINRFTGHTNEPYSVAQHSVMVSKIVPPHLSLCALLHDAAEAYMGDISRPLKQALDQLAPGIVKGIEHRLERAIAQKFRLPPPPWPEIVKYADNVALATEKRDLMPGGREEWPDLPLPLANRIHPKSASRAELDFMCRFDELILRQ